MKLTNIIHRWADIEKLKRGEKIWPVMASFHTCNACNQHCIGCAHAGTHTDEMMPEADHFALVESLLSVGVKAFDFAGGGEPLLQPYLPRLFEFIKSRGGYIGLLTNGLALTTEMLKAIVAYCTYIRISLEASCREDYAAYKQVPEAQWDTVIGNIKHLTAWTWHERSALEISLKFSVNKMLFGMKHYERAISLGRTLEVESVNIKANRFSSLEILPLERIMEEKILMRAIENLRAEKIARYWVAQVPFSDVPQCWLNPFQVVFDHAGNVSVCCYRYWDRDPELDLGNIYKRTFYDLWMDDSHWEKIKLIKRENCSRADCKFFSHHKAVNASLRRRHVHFI